MTARWPWAAAALLYAGLTVIYFRPLLPVFTTSLPHDIGEIRGRSETLQLRQQNFVQQRDDVYAVLWSAAAGFGDPLERDPERVAADVDNEAVSTEAARTIYGVVLDSNGMADAEQTQTLRRAIRRARLDSARKPAAAVKKLSAAVDSLATENLAIRIDAGEARFSCPSCAADLGPSSDNYKHYCARHDAPIESANAIIGDPARFIDARPVFRQFFCPGCGRLIENEVALEGDPLLRDIELRS